MSESNENGQRAIETVRSFLIRMDLAPREERLSDRNVFTVDFDGPATRGIAQVVELGERFVFHFVFSGAVPAEGRAHVAEFIARVNWQLIEGAFQLDFDTGEIRYKVGVDFTGVELSELLVRNMIMCGMETVETYAYALPEVAAGSITPAAAYRGTELKEPP